MFNRTVLVCFCVFGLTTACNIIVRITNQSSEPYFVEIKTPSGQKSPLLALNSMGTQATYNFNEQICSSPTSIKVYQKNGNNVGALISSSSAVLDGMGSIDYLIFPGGSINVGARIGVTCALGGCKQG
ncbi:hypothetical protein M3Y97_00629700 [Aphelenchoides bicaudatus]|nr:hypothetical protein M3Y97_00629700 [Aphelenchoides bicaudatus]